MKLRHDPEADAIYIQFSDKDVAKTRPVRGNTGDAFVDYAADGSVRGVEVLGVNSGIDLTGLPEPRSVYRLLREEDFVVRVPRGVDIDGVVVNKTPRAVQREEFLGKLLAPTDIELKDLSASARAALENYARFVLDSGDSPSASWNNPLLEICRAVEAELQASVGDVEGLEGLGEKTLGEIGKFLEQQAQNPVIRKRLTQASLSPDYLLDKLPEDMQALSSIRRVTGSAHGFVVAQNATRGDVDRALRIALLGLQAVIPTLIAQRKARRLVRKH